MTAYNKRVSVKTIEETYTDNNVPHEINEYNVKSYPTYDSSIGFSFDYPMRWLNDKSDYKAIGIRRLKVIPSSHSINFYIKTSTVIRDIIVNKYPYSADKQPTHIIIHDFIFSPIVMDFIEFIKITQQNSLDEVMTFIINSFNNKYGENVQFNYEYKKARFIVPIDDFDEDKPISDYMIEQYCDTNVDVDKETTSTLINRLSLSYSLKNDELRFYFDLLHWDYRKYLQIAPDTFDSSEIEYKHYSYVVEDPFHFTYADDGNIFTSSTLFSGVSKIWLYDENLTDLTINSYLIPLLQFLNQDIHGDLKTLTSGNLNKVVFKGVWDREVIQVHASFSDNNNGFIGLGGDFYEKPSVLYEPPTNYSNFNLWFTTNGRNRILLRYCKFFVGLCFIRNYNTSLATK